MYRASVRSLAKRAETVADDFKSSYKTLQASTDDFREFERLENKLTRFGRRAKAGTKPLIAEVEKLIDLVDARRQQLVWEGAGTGRVTKEKLDNIEATVNAAVAAIFERYPFRAGGSGVPLPPQPAS